MVIEFVATQCAEEWPAGVDHYTHAAYEHTDHYFLELMFKLGQIMEEVEGTIFGDLVKDICDSLHLDRDPAGFLYEHEEMDNEHNRLYYKEKQNDAIGSRIDGLAGR